MPKARKKLRLSTACLEENLDDIIAIAEKEGVVVDPTTISSSSTRYECPYKGCSYEFDLTGLLKHLNTHKLEDNCTTKCPFCEKRMNSLLLLSHLENGHPELDVKGQLRELVSSIDPKHKAIRDSVKSTDSAKRNSASSRMSELLESSIFTPNPSRLSFPEFRISLRRKLFEDTKVNAFLIFKFAVRVKTMEWGCLICTESVGLTFKNVISLRLNALFHLETHANEEHFEHLQKMISKEWSVLMKEVPTLPVSTMRNCGDLPIGRSFLSYCLLRERDDVGEAMDVIDKCYLNQEDAKKMRNALCLLCQSPFVVSLANPTSVPAHFQIDSHRHLKAKGWSEFTEVTEIAEVSHAAKSDVHSSLLFSSFLHLTNEQDASPKKLFKWRCTLCSLDVAVFPSSISLRFFALRHLEKEHPHTLNDHFYKHEWILLQMETSLVSMRQFSQIEHLRRMGRPLDITDPSDFIFPWQRAIRVPSPAYYTCGHCFFVSTETEIRDHLAGHGFVAGDGSHRLVVEDGGQEAMINERTIRGIRKSLSVPASILYDASAGDEEEEEEGDMQGTILPVPPRPTTPTTSTIAMSSTALLETPRSSSKYSLRARSAARYVPLLEEGETENNDTMSSEESDSGLEKQYHTMSGDETMEDTVDEGDMEEEEAEVMTAGFSEKKRRPSLPKATSAERKNTTTPTVKSKGGTNTCTESSVAFDDLYDTGIIAPLETGEGTPMKRREGEKVHEKAFIWEGEEPPLLTAEQVEIIREFKEGGRCSICPRVRGYRGVGRMTNVEQSMMAHYIVNHADNGDAMAIVTRKRFLLATSLAAGGMETVPPFLLQSVHPHHLTCSRCMQFKCGKQSNLVVHWEACTGVRGNKGRTANKMEKKKEEAGGKEKEGETKEERRKTVSVRCPLCREGWRKSTHYSDDVSVAIHLLLKHTTDKEAYEMAVQLEEETNMQSAFPWIHLTDSFTLRVDNPDKGMQCALCHVNSQTMASAIRHATRSHATAKQKVDAGFTPGLLSCPLPSSSCSLRSVLICRTRSIAAINFLHVFFSHTKKEKEARRFMKMMKQEDKEKLREETNLRLDVDECVKTWKQRAPRLLCALCSQSSNSWPLHMHHFAEHNCGTVEDKLIVKRRSTTQQKTMSALLSLGASACGETATAADTTPKRRTSLKQMTPVSALSLLSLAASSSSQKRGRGKAPEAAMACLHCPRAIYASCVYAPSVSMDIHLLQMHPQEERSTPSSTFPFVDFSLSSHGSLQCGLCVYTAKESRYVVDHAWTKHAEESKAAQGLAAWAEYELSLQKKRAKQRTSCSRSAKRARKLMRDGGGGEEEEEEETDEGQPVQKKRRSATPPPTATAVIRIPRQRSTISRWLDHSLAGTSTYSPSTKSVNDDLRERLDRLFASGVDSPSSSQQQQHGSASIFKELPETSMSLLTPKSRARDISHIKGLEGVRCSVCAFKGKDTESLRIHFNEAHQDVSQLSAPSIFPCAACSRVFNNKKKWRCHCEEDHEPKDRPFQCHKCEYRYETHQKLRAHQIRVHESEILVHPVDRTCLKCNKLFGSLRAFQEHKKRHEAREMDE